MTVALVIAAVVTAGAVVLVSVPFLRDPAPVDDRLREPRAYSGEGLAFAEERDRALAALKELEFDHRTGKLTDGDYRELVSVYRRRAADALKGLEAQ